MKIITNTLFRTGNVVASDPLPADRSVLKLFSEAAVRVPAYKDFLKQAGVNPKSVKTIADFKQLPLVDKKNYLTKYPLAELCWDGTLDHSRIIFS